jgi:hypothetical protein
MPIELVKAFPGVQVEWSYTPSRPSLSITLRRWRAKLSRRAAPAWSAVVPAVAGKRWLVYFVYTGAGGLNVSQRFTLERLQQEDASLLVVCACPKNGPVLDELRSMCDALYWKAENGWDFSGYAIALSELARLSAGADVLVMNDSVLGPFKPLVPFMVHAPWRLTAFTGNAAQENHLQSYAFVIKNIDTRLTQVLGPVLSTHWSYDAAGPVILLQETLLARVAHQYMSVGCYFFTDGSLYEDLCLNCPELLLEAGFPLLKKSLFGKFAGVFQDPAAMQTLIRKLNHPSEALA